MASLGVPRYYFFRKCPLLWERTSFHLAHDYGVVYPRFHTPSGSAVFAGLMFVTNRQTDRATSVTIGRISYIRIAIRPDNIQ